MIIFKKIMIFIYLKKIKNKDKTKFVKNKLN